MVAGDRCLADKVLGRSGIGLADMNIALFSTLCGTIKVQSYKENSVPNSIAHGWAAQCQAGRNNLYPLEHPLWIVIHGCEASGLDIAIYKSAFALMLIAKV